MGTDVDLRPLPVREPEPVAVAVVELLEIEPVAGGLAARVEEMLNMLATLEEGAELELDVDKRAFFASFSTNLSFQCILRRTNSFGKIGL